MSGQQKGDTVPHSSHGRRGDPCVPINRDASYAGRYRLIQIRFKLIPLPPHSINFWLPGLKFLFCDTILSNCVISHYTTYFYICQPLPRTSALFLRAALTAFNATLHCIIWSPVCQELRQIFPRNVCVN